ncbi:hypothetical protein ACTID9_19750 [Brevibacillus fluminis]|uniref:hypothetical protein n=1 Tax=Brevibacillus fluminis TaxID=511487 RepID=UPI003F89B3A6
MELLDVEPARIWRLLIPAANWLYTDEVPEDELIFHYRKHVYFVHEDGAVLSIPAPDHLERLELEDLYDLLAESEDSHDFDDEGVFDTFSVLSRMGYLVPTKHEGDRHHYHIEIVNTMKPDSLSVCYDLEQVSFEFALYHALMRCHELNEQCDWDYEHEIKEIKEVAFSQLG